MAFNTQYETTEPAREDLDRSAGEMVIEFGAPWCGWCQGAQGAIAAGLAGQPSLRHIKIEDGKGRRLGRSFRIKLWPTLVFLKNGEEVARVVRPDGAGEVKQALEQMLRGTATP